MKKKETARQKKARLEAEANARIEASVAQARERAAQIANAMAEVKPPPYVSETRIHTRTRIEKKKYFSPEQIKAILTGIAVEGAPDTAHVEYDASERGVCVTVYTTEQQFT